MAEDLAGDDDDVVDVDDVDDDVDGNYCDVYKQTVYLLDDGQFELT